ncbi:MAG: peptide deformylase [bacterium]
MNILLFPNPVLREKTRFVKTFDNSLNLFTQSLTEFMYINKGCVGLAAPQVGELIRVVVVNATGHKKVTKTSGLLVLVNPEIISFSGSTINREGCLSVPDFTGNVERANQIKIKYQDIHGKSNSLETSGFEAVILQHEIDHLDGVLFIDRIRNSKRDLFKRKLY